MLALTEKQRVRALAIHFQHRYAEQHEEVSRVAEPKPEPLSSAGGLSRRRCGLLPLGRVCGSFDESNRLADEGRCHGVQDKQAQLRQVLGMRSHR